MTEVAQVASPAKERNDEDQIVEIVSRLGRRYTRDQISTAELTSRVRTFYSGFATARIRSFVGIFVERLVRRSIETPTAKP
ncbi:hypothetical protein BJ973_005861 [Actinoplanes tereljensis]|uniref:three-helix bundle dimerization domain-containing protein n=1 Tax=Paractinoplanes tereljensis TaxID=571912 RepID=UPI001942EBF0|nr:hypothetical protein [Actinoplanes tereljensis]